MGGYINHRRQVEYRHTVSECVAALFYYKAPVYLVVTASKMYFPVQALIHNHSFVLIILFQW